MALKITSTNQTQPTHSLYDLLSAHSFLFFFFLEATWSACRRLAQGSPSKQASRLIVANAISHNILYAQDCVCSVFWSASMCVLQMVLVTEEFSFRGGVKPCPKPNKCLTRQMDIPSNTQENLCSWEKNGQKRLSGQETKMTHDIFRKQSWGF